jgi:hypothetical protein
MGNSSSAPAAGAASGGAKPGLAPRAVKFGAPAELGPILGACFSRVGSSAEKPPVVVAASADTVDLFNGLTGAWRRQRRALTGDRRRTGCFCCCGAAPAPGVPAAPAHASLPHALLASSTPRARPSLSSPPPPPAAADRKQRLKRRVPLTCVDFKADTTFGFVMLAGTAGGEVVLYDVATLKCVHSGAASAAAWRGSVARRGRADSV